MIKINLIPFRDIEKKENIAGVGRKRSQGSRQNKTRTQQT